MSADEDKVAMLAFKGRGDQFNDLATWSPSTTPCGDGTDDFYAGWNSDSGAWSGVTCCADGSWGSRSNGQRCSNAGRVTHIGLDDKPGLRGTLEDLAPLSALIHLSLYLCSGVSGDVASLEDMPQLSHLSLAGSNVYGNALPLRSIPGLLNWGEGSTRDYTACAAHRSCPRTSGGQYPASDEVVLGQLPPPVRSSLIANAGTHVGVDNCACCGYVPQATDPATSECIAALDLTLTLGDKSAMLVFKGRGDVNNDLTSWSGATEPCRDGWDSRDAGWRHVMCCASYNGYVCTGRNVARVTYVGLNNKPGLRGFFQDLTPMSALIHLTVSQCDSVSGIANVRGMSSLRTLNLYGTHGVYVNIVTLQTLSQLSLLWLAGSNAYGDAAVIRDNVPQLARWGSGHQDFTACAVACPVGSSLLVDAASRAGVDECACCDSSTDTPQNPWRRRHPTTGICYNPNPPAAVAPAAPAQGGGAAAASVAQGGATATADRDDSPAIVLVATKASGVGRQRRVGIGIDRGRGGPAVAVVVAAAAAAATGFV